MSFCTTEPDHSDRARIVIMTAVLPRTMSTPADQSNTIVAGFIPREKDGGDVIEMGAAIEYLRRRGHSDLESLSFSTEDLSEDNRHLLDSELQMIDARIAAGLLPGEIGTLTSNVLTFWEGADPVSAWKSQSPKRNKKTKRASCRGDNRRQSQEPFRRGGRGW